MIYARFLIPIFAAMFLLANPVFSQGGMLMPSTWPTSQPSAKPDAPAWEEPNARVDWSYLKTNRDTVIDGWQIRYMAEPQGASKWQWLYSVENDRTQSNYYFDSNGKCVWASLILLPKKLGDLASILDAICLDQPPVPFQKTGLVPKKDPHTQAIGELDSTQTDLMALNLFGELVSLTDTVTKLGSLKAGNFLFNHSKFDGSYQMLSQNIAGQWYSTSNPDVWHGDLTFAKGNEFVVSWFFKIEKEQIMIDHVTFTQDSDRGAILPDIIFLLKDIREVTGNR